MTTTPGAPGRSASWLLPNQMLQPLEVSHETASVGHDRRCGSRNGVCGGCFNAIPRQLVLELKLGEKNAVCEYCGRIVVGEPISLAVDGEPQPVAQVTGEPEEAEAEE